MPIASRSRSLATTLLPTAAGLRVEHISTVHQPIELTLGTTVPSAQCPICTSAASRVVSRRSILYQRRRQCRSITGNDVPARACSVWWRILSTNDHHDRRREAIWQAGAKLDFIHFSTTAESSRHRVRVCDNRYLWWAVRVVGPILAHRVIQCQFLDITLIA